jgi:hypothetical protein
MSHTFGNVLVSKLLENGRLAPSQLTMFRHCLTILHLCPLRPTTVRGREDTLGSWLVMAARLPHLEELVFLPHPGCVLNLSKMRQVMSPIPALAPTLLRLVLSVSHKDHRPGSHAIYDAVKHLTRLTHLSYEGEEDLVRVAPELPQLRELHVNKCCLADPLASLSSLSGVTTLTSLILSNVSPVNNECVRELGSLTWLQSLALVSLDATCPPHIERLTSLTYCHGYLDAGWEPTSNDIDDENQLIWYEMK